jgi:hypothetical protein
MFPYMQVLFSRGRLGRNANGAKERERREGWAAGRRVAAPGHMECGNLLPLYYAPVLAILSLSKNAPKHTSQTG